MTSSEKIRLILLPGLHGTGGLFQPFLKECPPDFDPYILTYPGDIRLSYDELEKIIVSRLRETSKRIIFLGESFSGPLALRLALRYPEQVIGVILVASFVTSPAANWVRYLPWESIFFFGGPIYALRKMFVRSKDKATLIKQISSELKKATPTVLAWRVNEALNCDATAALRDCPAPVLYLSGTEDTVISRKSVDTIGRIRRSVVYRSITAPHFLLLASPKEAWSAISEFTDQYCAPETSPT